MRTPAAVVCSATCTRAAVPSIVNVPRFRRATGLRNARSIRRASGDRSARRSGTARAPAFDVAERRAAPAPSRVNWRRSCDGLWCSVRKRAGTCAGASGDARCGAFARAICSAEYQACESARRSVAASGAVRILKPSCCVIMAASCARAVNGASPIRCRVVMRGALLGYPSIVPVVEALRLLQVERVLRQIEGYDEIAQ